jgi:hypothetical protein
MTRGSFSSTSAETTIEGSGTMPVSKPCDPVVTR